MQLASTTAVGDDFEEKALVAMRLFRKLDDLNGIGTFGRWTYTFDIHWIHWIRQRSTSQRDLACHPPTLPHLGHGKGGARWPAAWKA